MLMPTGEGGWEPLSVTSEAEKWGNGNVIAPWAGPGTRVTTSWGGDENVPQMNGANPKVQPSQGWSPTNLLDSKSSTGVGSARTSSRSSDGDKYIPPTLRGQRSTTQYLGGGTLPTFASPTYNAPTYNAPAPYAAPGYDYNRINYLATQQLAPQARALRGALYTGIGKIASTDNPYMQREGRKNLMQGYGTGLSEASAGASRTAQQLYNTEYAGNVDSARTKYQGEMSQAATQYQGALQGEATRYGGALSAAQASFQAALAEWQKSLQTVTTEERDYGQGFSATPGVQKTGGYLNSGMDYEDYIKNTSYLGNNDNRTSFRSMGLAY